MAGIYDFPTAQPFDRVRAVAKALGFLGTATWALEDMAAQKRGPDLNADDYEGLSILLQTCAETLAEVEKTQ
ncbi:MAG: hypothetical protein HDR50_04685 [Desulfovibrio sp.]|uniref:hypothetical protein n=1 Tax=Desulfovibrio sp. TaxID=885 RepID=UPI001A7C8785|nr:hypothetical protein [Desulfovibrio sp.]MBD5416951.1 hypothetical protein [Desulfovibrio sp.]